MNECLNNEPNYITYYNSIQMCLPLGLGYEITPTDELLSFLEAIKGVDLSKYMVRKETRGRKGHNRIDLLRIPLGLNPILDVPFILSPVATIVIVYILVSSGFCPKIVLEVPWTMLPVIMGFLATGGKPMGAIFQLIVLAASTLIYIPFLIAYEKFQAKDAAAE